MVDDKFVSIRLHLKKDGVSWSIVGMYPNNHFKVLGVLDAPLDKKLVREITALIARRFNVAEIVED